MRMHGAGLMLGLAMLAGCGADEAAPEAAAPTEATGAGVAQAAPGRSGAREVAPSAAAGARLQAPLPGGVLPAFPHSVAVDLTSQVGPATTRTVTLRVQGPDPEQALATLADQFAAGGLERGQVSLHGNAIQQGFWTPGKGRGLMVVSQGGTHVGVVARPGTGDAGVAESALVLITINAP